MPEQKPFSAGRAAALGLSLAVFCLFLIPVFIGIHNIGNITGLIVFGLLSLLLLRLPQCRQKARARCRKTGWRVFYRIVCVFIAAVLLLAMVLAVCIFGAALRRPADEGTVVVLGAQVDGTTPSIMLEERLLRAESYLEEHPEAPCIVSGGQGSGEQISEAEAMADWLEAHGISADRIFLEAESTSTAENLRFSAALIRRENLSPSVVIVTNEFHECRAMYEAEKSGLDPSPAAAGTRFWLFPTYFVREMYGLLAAWLSIG